MGKTKSWGSVVRFLLIAGILLGNMALGTANANIVGLWNFDDESEEILEDSSGNDNDGTIRGGEWVDGKRGMALQFNGTADNGVIIEHKPNQDPASMKEITVEAWVMIFSAPTGNIIRKGIWVSGKDTTGWGLDIINKDFSVRGWVYTEDALSLVDPKVPILELETWHHLALVYDGKEVIVYIDGEIYGKTGAAAALKANDEQIGIGIRPDFSNPFSGIIDEVAIWDEARTQDQIKKDMDEISLAVEASGKLAIAWGKVKTQ